MSARVGVRHQALAVDTPGNMFAFELGYELAQIDPDQVGGQAIDGRLKGAVLRAAAPDLRFVIAGEEPVAAESIKGVKFFSKKTRGSPVALHAGRQPFAGRSGIGRQRFARRVWPRSRRSFAGSAVSAG